MKKNKRSYTAVAASDLLCICIDQTVFNLYMKTTSTEKMDQQIAVLKLIPQFSLMDPGDLVIIAQLLQKHAFFSNQIVIKENEHADKMYIGKSVKKSSRAPSPCANNRSFKGNPPGASTSI